MSQRLTQDVAQSLKKGTMLYHNVIVFVDDDGNETPATAKVAGKCRAHHYEDFVLPIKRNYGDMSVGAVTKFGTDLWRTDPEKEVVRRVVRSRLPRAEVEPVAPAVVRRTRRRS